MYISHHFTTKFAIKPFLEVKCWREGETQDAKLKKNKQTNKQLFWLR